MLKIKIDLSEEEEEQEKKIKRKKLIKKQKHPKRSRVHPKNLIIILFH